MMSYGTRISQRFDGNADGDKSFKFKLGKGKVIKVSVGSESVSCDGVSGEERGCEG